MGDSISLPFDPSCIGLCRMRCAANYYLLAGDITDLSRYPATCFANPPSTCEEGWPLDPSVTAHLSAPGLGQQWYRYRLPTTGTRTITASAWTAPGWSIAVYNGWNCPTKVLKGFLTTASPALNITLGPAPFWYLALGTIIGTNLDVDVT